MSLPSGHIPACRPLAWWRFIEWLLQVLIRASLSLLWRNPLELIFELAIDNATSINKKINT